MTIFFTADIHAFHDNIIEYCDRPFKNAMKMWYAIKRNWNSVVGPDDIVWILGDLTMKGRDFKSSLGKMLDSLNGQKHLIYGNHDQMSPRDHSDMGISTVHYPMFFFQGHGFNWWLAHDPALANVLSEGDILLCGHEHNNFHQYESETGVTIINVGVDVRDFTPMSEEQVREVLKGPISKMKPSSHHEAR